jgi:hypothetical protein
LLKVRTAVARVGEMDVARWWNSSGQLGPQGASVLRRGFPRTHHFAQASSVFMVAAARCAQIFDPPGSVTLWRLTDPIEGRLETLWEGWLDDAKSWRPFFERIAAIKAADLSVLRAWFATTFFDYHLKAYSKSRRKAPIFWLSTAIIAPPHLEARGSAKCRSCRKGRYAPPVHM